MHKPVLAGLILVVMAFTAGYLIRGSQPGPTTGRRVLYYVDPMHPSYRSDKPGTAPDCGMALVPVYEGERLADQLQLPPKTVFVDDGTQKLTGIRVETVGASSEPRQIRTSGRVEADENRVYRLTAATEGWIRTLGNNPAGTVVKKSEVLATFFSLELRGVERGYIGALQVGKEPGQISQANLRISEDQLRSLGMSEEQIQELGKTKEYVNDVKIVSPADGVVLSRNISLQQRFQAQTEFYRIADLGKVWIVADIYSDEPIAPGTRATVAVEGMNQSFTAVVSNSVPLFDAASRTLKLRLEADNPGQRLRPDMLVDVEFNARPSDGISVPAEAVIDSGHSKIVYVETGNDLFTPRPVEVGQAFDDRVAIVRGLEKGDRVVASGTFLIDSESRMKPLSTQHD